MSDEVNNISTTPEANLLPKKPLIVEAGNDSATQDTPKQPDKIGSQFAALSRKEKAIRAKEAEVAAKAEQVKSLETKWSDLEKLSAEEILDYVSTRRGIAPEEVIKGHLSKVTGQPTAEQALKESKDPAVQALAAKLEAQAKANQELQKKLQEKEEAERAATQRAQVAYVQNECLTSATASWSDESDYPLFFADQADLAQSVFNYCARRVQEYREETGGVTPEDSEIADLIKAAPELLLREQLASPRGKRIAGLKAARQAEAAEKPTPIARKPKLNVPLVPHTDNRSVVEEEPITNIRTSTDKAARLARARASYAKEERS